jgi:hypothetical protein
MRLASLFLAGLALLSFAGCGSGGGGGGVGGSVVLGQVVERDGSSDDVGGVVVECPETGDVDVTDGEGRFEVDVPAGTDFAVEFDDPKATPAGDGGDCDEGADPVKDGGDIDGEGVVFEPLDDGEVCEVEVVLEDGEVVECRETRDDDDGGDDEGDEHEGEARLFPSDLYASQGVLGEVEVEQEEGCFEVELDVSGFDAPHVLSVVLFHPEGDEFLLGTFEVNGEGQGHLGIGWCKGDPLPFGVDSLAGLAGFLVLVLDEEGQIVFEGHVPGLGTDEDHEGKDDDGVHDGDDGDGDDGDDEKPDGGGDDPVDGDGDGGDGYDGEGDGIVR